MSSAGFADTRLLQALDRACYEQADLIRCSQGELFGREAPKLPAPPLLAFDNVSTIAAAEGAFGRGLAVANKPVGRLQWVFDSHFLEDPVIPGSMILDGLFQLAGFFGAYSGLRGKGRAARARRIAFHSEVTPADEVLTYRIDIRAMNFQSSILIADGEASVGTRRCVTATQMCLIVR